MLKRARANIGLLILLSTVLVLTYPLQQLFSCAGQLLYQNGLDEGSYLQYDFARIAALNYWRPSQWVVVWLHQFGLSGAAINLVFDLVTITFFLCINYLILIKLHRDAMRATAQTVVITFFPLLFLTFNPLLQVVFEAVLNSGAVYWVSVPHTDFLPLLRSPEPQFSYLLIAAAIFLAQRRREPLYLFLVVPFLYSFVALPWLYVAVGAVAYYRLKCSRGKSALLAAVICLPITALYFNFLVGSEAKQMLVITRLPLISLTGTLALALYYLLRRRVAEWAKFPIQIAIAAIWFSQNQQIVSGWLGQPNNFEQYFGCTVLALIIAATISTHLIAAFFIVLALLLAGLRGARSYRYGTELLSGVCPDITQLKANPELVVAPDIRLATLLNLAFPRQGATALSASRAYLKIGQGNFDRYACVREQLQSQPELASRYASILSGLDGLYRYGNNDYILNTINRRGPAFESIDVSSRPGECPRLKLIECNPSCAALP